MKVVYCKYSGYRKKQYRVITKKILKDNLYFYIKEADNLFSKSHIQTIFKNYKTLESEYKNLIFPKGWLSEDVFFQEEVDGLTLESILLNYLKTNQLEKAKDLLALYKSILDENIESSNCKFNQTREFTDMFGTIPQNIQTKSFKLTNLDFGFENFIIKNSNFYVIDYEWVFDFPIPFKFVYFRAINYFINKYEYIINNKIDLYDFFDITNDEKQIFDKMESMFQANVLNIDKNYKKNYLKSSTYFELKDLNYYFKIDEELKTNHRKIEKLMLENNELKAIYENNTKDINEYKEKLQKYQHKLESLKATYSENLNKIESEKQNIYEMYQSVFKTATQYQETLQSIYNSNMWKVASRYYRFRGKIDKYFKFLNKKKKQEVKNKTNIENDNIDTDVMEDSNLIDFDTSAYNYRSNQDIIILSVIDWDFRYQRPQHIADNFRKLNHRVFYFNANYTEKKLSIKEQKDNLYSVNLSCDYGERIYDIDFTLDESKYKEQISNLLKQFNINEATVIVEYPTWAPVAKHLKENWKFNIVFDYIDDYSGFEDTVSLKLHSFTEQLFKISDFVIATSNFLEARALEYSKNVEVIRNGTEFDFFNKAINKESKNSNKKIGYYGAIAEWFDLEKIQYIAKNRPEYEIELIGNVTNKSCSALKKYKNIKFLGEKPYSELPKYLMDYDVCLIPFKSDIDLIKATNPVKFYEYLSAGKKIVATEIPELEPYRDKFVYLTNSNEKFLKYVDMCLDGKDSLYKPSELVGFAIKQDWSIRVKDIEKAIKKYTPLVSIIVVTYNNLKYTKMCIDSIIGKTAYPNYEIVIVDNCSKDDTRGYLKNLEKMHDNIKIILNDENLGFAAGNNVGIKNSKGEYIILLNNDTVVTNGWMTSLIKHLDEPKIGMVCPVTNSIGNEAQINVNYSKIEDMDSFALNYTTKHQGELYNDINVLAMFCVAFKRTIIDEVGYLDENYAVGMFEDDDYSFALKNKGYIVACAEDVFIHHFGSVSFKKLDDANYRRIFEKNKKYFEEKWNTLWIPHKYRDDVKPN